MIPCDHCKRNFQPTPQQLEFILTSKEKGMTFIMLACGSCGIYSSFNPSNPKEQQEAEKPLRTPILGIQHGYVSFVDWDAESFYGCGETGTRWQNEKDLFGDIELIIEKYPHRAHCYIKIDNGWIANPNEPSNMNELISKEV